MYTEKTYYLTHDEIDRLAKSKPIIMYRFRTEKLPKFPFLGCVDEEIELITLIPESLLPD